MFKFVIQYIDLGSHISGRIDSSVGRALASHARGPGVESQCCNVLDTY